MCLLLLSGSVTWYFVHKSKTGFKDRLVTIAKKEVEKWKGYTELSPFVSDWLIDYWKAVGKLFSKTEMQDPSVQATYPWSSAFISYLFQTAGANNQFPYSAAHSGYFQEAKRNRNNPNAPLIGYRINEYAPKKGDLIVFTRESGKGYDTDGHFAAHGELIVEEGKGYLKTAGGNVGDSTGYSRFSTDENGYVTTQEKPVFMVIKNNIK